jgi:hypothetical protein
MMNTKPLVTYSVFDRVYQNGILRVLRGKPDAGAASLGTIDRTVTTGIPFLPTDVDVKPLPRKQPARPSPAYR